MEEQNAEDMAKYMKDDQVAWDLWSKDWDLRMKSHREGVEKLSDAELMQRHNSYLDQLLEKAGSGYLQPSVGPDLALVQAVYIEVERRALAASWFWRRWRKHGEYDKWVRHRARTGERARKVAMEIASRVERLKKEAQERVNGGGVSH